MRKISLNQLGMIGLFSQGTLGSELLAFESTCPALAAKVKGLCCNPSYKGLSISQSCGHQSIHHCCGQGAK